MHKQTYAVNKGYDLAGQVDATSYEHNKFLIVKIAKKCYARVVEFNLPMDFDDVLQEVRISWWQARESFDPQSGFRFSTYFVRSAYNNMNKVVNRLMRRNPPGTITFDGDINNEGFSLDSVIESPDPRPDEVLEMISNAEEVLDGLSDLARLAVEWIVTPPDFLLWEVGAKQEKAKIAENRDGKRRKPPVEVTLPMVVEYIAKSTGFGDPGYKAIMKELKSIAS